jgi:hypothetical protein
MVSVVVGIIIFVLLIAASIYGYKQFEKNNRHRQVKKMAILYYYYFILVGKKVGNKLCLPACIAYRKKVYLTTYKITVTWFFRKESF